jgi:hypothetical protein
MSTDSATMADVGAGSIVALGGGSLGDADAELTGESTPHPDRTADNASAASWLDLGFAR